MPRTTAEKRAAFRSLHASGCFVLPNPWDVGSARMLQHLGFEALATTSAGYAWSSGRADYAVTRDDVIEHLTVMSAATDLPINADFESGFANEPEKVAESVTLAIRAGVSGLSVEDRVVGDPAKLLDAPIAVERIRAARAAIDASGEDVILVARTERLLLDPGAVQRATDTLVAMADAGADCLYAPGNLRKADLAAIVRAVSPKPVNALALNLELGLADYAELGVRRVSVGGSLARVAWAAMIGAAEQLKSGSFAVLGSGTPGKRLNEVFGRFPPRSPS
jgi:2-methylisocitrate lyase-like PEP mutase family enzyme